MIVDFKKDRIVDMIVYFTFSDRLSLDLHLASVIFKPSKM